MIDDDDREAKAKKLAVQLGAVFDGHDLPTVLDALLLTVTFIADEQSSNDKRRYLFKYLRECLEKIEGESFQ